MQKTRLASFGTPFLLRLVNNRLQGLSATIERNLFLAACAPSVALTLSRYKRSQTKIKNHL